MIIKNLFPIPIGFFKLDRELSELELRFIFNLSKSINQGNFISDDRYILNSSELGELRIFFESSVLNYFKAVYDTKNLITPYITQSWVNYNEKDQWHHKHSHPNSFISSVFYVQANNQIDRIYFYKNIADTLSLSPTSFNEWNSESWWFEVNTGDLIFFPSYLHHSVEPNKSTSTRVSISFNTFLKGSLGDFERSTELYLS